MWKSTCTFWKACAHIYLHGERLKCNEICLKQIIIKVNSNEICLKQIIIKVNSKAGGVNLGG